MGNPIVETRRSSDRLISIMGFLILVRCHLYIELGPWFPNPSSLTYLNRNGRGFREDQLICLDRIIISLPLLSLKHFMWWKWPIVIENKLAHKWTNSSMQLVYTRHQEHHGAKPATLLQIIPSRKVNIGWSAKTITFHSIVCQYIQ